MARVIWAMFLTLLMRRRISRTVANLPAPCPKTLRVSENTFENYDFGSPENPLGTGSPENPQGLKRNDE
jgi:hypothetical protein